MFQNRENLAHTLARLIRQTHRENRVGFVHTRLAIIEPTPESDQPLTDPETGAFITFNGEIYNYVALREALEMAGERFRTSGDTEVLLRGYLREGLEFFRKIRGMYAFVVFDPRTVMISDKVRPHHLERKAILYVRQSSAHQVLHNRESSALQYAMRDRLTALGWSEIEVIDDDLGRSAAGGVQRAGFERMVAEVCLGKVGAVCAR